MPLFFERMLIRRPCRASFFYLYYEYKFEKKGMNEKNTVDNLEIERKVIVNKSQLITKVAEQATLSKKETSKVVETTLAVIQSTLQSGESVHLTGFGNFEVRSREARRGRNPLTGEEIQIAATKIPAFKAGKTLRTAIQ